MSPISGCPGPTVTNTALSVAHDFGFKRIILAGVDFCYTKDGFTHAKGSNEALAGARFNLTSLQVETNEGFMAPTGYDYFQAAANFASQAKRLVSNSCRIINTSGKAAKIENVEYIPLAEIELDQEYPDTVDIVAAKIRGSESDTRFYQKSVDELRRAQYQVKSIARLAENARRINEEMYNSLGVIENYKDKQKLDQIEKKFKRDHRQYSKLVKKLGIRSFLKLAKPFTDEEWTAEEAKQLGNVFYDAYLEGASKLLRIIDQSLARIAARQEENADIPDFSVLFAQCRIDRSFGRVRLWRKKYAPAILSADVALTFTEFEAKFHEILSTTTTRHFELVKSYNSLKLLKQRAGLLFKHKKIPELQDLLAGLDKHEEQAAAIPYRHLINAYLAKLQNNPSEAQQAYQQIIEAGDILLEEALTRVAGIGIDQDDTASASLSLQCLSQLNPLYLPMHAEMRRLHGENMLAIDAYNSYIRQFPEDVLVQIKLAMLYIEQCSYHAAELMLDYILRQKPNLETALAIKHQLQLLKVET